jgi:hypothetical protein
MAPEPTATARRAGSRAARSEARALGDPAAPAPAADLMHGAGANDVATGKRMRDGMQERIAHLHRQRPGGGYHGVELGIG